MRRILAGVLLCLLPALPAVATVYKWTDEKGLVHFSDEPHPGAERLEVGQPSVYNPPPVDLRSGERPASTAIGYMDFSIAQPQPEATIRNNPGTVMVRFRIEPELRGGDQIRVLLDGKPVDTGATTIVALQRVDRGTHTLSAVVEDKAGAVVARAAPVTFYMHRPSVNIPANKPPASGGAK